MENLSPLCKKELVNLSILLLNHKIDFDRFEKLTVSFQKSLNLQSDLLPSAYRQLLETLETLFPKKIPEFRIPIFFRAFTAISPSLIDSLNFQGFPISFSEIPSEYIRHPLIPNLFTRSLIKLLPEPISLLDEAFCCSVDPENLQKFISKVKLLPSKKQINFILKELRATENQLWSQKYENLSPVVEPELIKTCFIDLTLKDLEIQSWKSPLLISLKNIQEFLYTDLDRFHEDPDILRDKSNLVLLLRNSKYFDFLTKLPQKFLVSDHQIKIQGKKVDSILLAVYEVSDRLNNKNGFLHSLMLNLDDPGCGMFHTRKEAVDDGIKKLLDASFYSREVDSEKIPSVVRLAEEETPVVKFSPFRIDAEIVRIMKRKRVCLETDLLSVFRGISDQLSVEHLRSRLDDLESKEFVRRSEDVSGFVVWEYLP
jgi:hypothetical protein